MPPKNLFSHFPKLSDKYFGTVHFPGVFIYFSCMDTCWPQHTIPFDVLFPLFSCPQKSNFLLPSASALHNLSILPPNSESWLCTAKLHARLVSLLLHRVCPCFRLCQLIRILVASSDKLLKMRHIVLVLLLCGAPWTCSTYTRNASFCQTL